MTKAFRHLLLFAVALSTGCTLISGTVESEPQEGLEIPVVDETDGFNPAEAVDDDDEVTLQSAVSLKGDEATDQEAFDPRAEERLAGDGDGEVRPGGVIATSASADAAADVELPEDEKIATAAEVESLIEEREEAVEDARESDDDRKAKIAIATNPAVEPRGPSESTPSRLLDIVMETLVVAAAALVIAALVTFFHHLPKAVRMTSIAGLAGVSLWVGLALA